MGGGVREDGVLRTTGGGGVGTEVEIVAPLGQQPMASSIGVVIADDQTPIPVSSTPPADTIANGTINGVGQEIAVVVPEGYNSVLVKFTQNGALDATIVAIDGTSAGFTSLLRLFNFISGKWEEFVNLNNFPLGTDLLIPAISGQTISIAVNSYNSGSGDFELIATNANPHVYNLTDSELALRLNTLGQKTAANSAPVVIASDQSAIPISGTVDTELPPAASLADNVANPTVPGVGAFGMMFDGVTWDRLRGDSANGILVNHGTNNIVSTKGDLEPEAPTVAIVGVASAQHVAADSTRRGLHLRNLSQARISLGFGFPAVLDSGITLYPRDSYQMGEYDFDLGAVNAIASAAASNLAIQEYLT